MNTALKTLGPEAEREIVDILLYMMDDYIDESIEWQLDGYNISDNYFYEVRESIRKKLLKQLLNE